MTTPRVRFVPPAEATRLARAGAVVFDARGLKDRALSPVSGAVGFSWTRWRRGWLRDGRLPEDPEPLRAHLRDGGLRFDQPAVVGAAGPEGFGEEGRLAWTLAWLGHQQVRVLDRHIRHLGDLPESAPGPVPSRLDTVDPHVRATFDEAQAAQQARSAVIWDTRSPEEFAGQTPYGEARGGHIPGAVHLYWKDLYGADGALLPDDQLHQKISSAGIPIDQPVVATCSGGVRSALAWCVLEHLGHPHAANFDGGMWQWSADASRPLATRR